jgi:hypothetical protein
MKCKECEDRGLKSTLSPGISTATAMAYVPFYYDEDGKIVYNKDPNIYTTEWHCSKGHTFATYRGRDEDEVV